MSEVTRLKTLQSYQILDTPPEDDFDDLVRLAAQICATPIATVTFIDDLARMTLRSYVKPPHACRRLKDSTACSLPRIRTPCL
jgi:hypothetical protein